MTKALGSVWLFLLMFIIGCKTSPKLPEGMRFSEYTGKDVLEWETSQGAMADTSFEVPVYKGWPSQPYVVIGEMYHRDERRYWREREIRDAAKGAKMLGGQAIILRSVSESGVAALTGTAGVPRVADRVPGIRPRMAALVIRWQTDTELEAAQALREKLKRELLAEYPLLEWNSDVSELVRKYLYQLSQGKEDQETYRRYREIMGRISTPDALDLSGQWVFKARSQEKRLVSDEKESQWLGLAAVKTEGQNITVVSTEGKTEMSFSGTNENGRLSGQVGLGGLSCKAEGVAVGDKISLSFQTLTPNGTTQGTIVLQRNKMNSRPKLQKL